MKELWRKIVTCSVLVMLLLGSAVSVTGCKEKEPTVGEAMEEAGEEMQDAAEDTAEAVEEAADTAEDEM